MANYNIQAKFTNYTGTAAAITAANPILLKGELGIESDTRKAKVGDGVTAWTALPYMNVTPEEIAELGGGDMTKAIFATIDGDNGFVDKAITANKLAAQKTISLTGDITGTVNTDFENNVSLATVLANVVTAGTGTKVTVDAKGRVTAIATLTEADIPTISTAKITGLGSAAAANTGVATGNVPVIGADGKLSASILRDPAQMSGAEALAGTDTAGKTISAATLNAWLADSGNDVLGTAAYGTIGTAAGNVVVLESTGKLNEAILPRLAMTEVFVVADETAMLALTAQPGDFAIRTDENKTYILSAEPATELANWLELKTAPDGVQVINGKSGLSVTLTTSDIAEGSNLYWTQARFNTAFDAAIVTTNVGDLADGDDVLFSTDTFVFNGGTA